GPRGAFCGGGVFCGRANLSVRLIDGGKPLLLAGDEPPKSAPVWSPDGRRIAFLRGQPNVSRDNAVITRIATIHVIPMLGGPERKLAELSVPPPASNSAPQL